MQMVNPVAGPKVARRDLRFAFHIDHYFCFFVRPAERIIIVIVPVAVLLVGQVGTSLEVSDRR